MSNIFSLPPELLSQILVDTLAEAREYNNASTYGKPFPFASDATHWLRLTNRAFNSVILSSPEIWSFVAITENIPTYGARDIDLLRLKWKPHTLHCIERSGTCPLDVTLGNTQDHALPRLETLTVLAWNSQPNPSLPLAVVNAPNVEHLTVTGRLFHRIRFSSSNMPRLRSLRFMQCEASFVTLLNSMAESLEQLDISFLTGGPDNQVEVPSKTPFLALHTLRINMMSRWNLLTEYIHVPNLRKLTLSSPPTNAPHDHTRYRCPRQLEMMPHLHSLEWLSVAAATVTPKIRESFEAILTACPNVQQLTVVEKLVKEPKAQALSRFGPLTEELKALATKDENWVTFCAGLKVLKVSCPSLELLDEVMKLRKGVLEVVQTGYRATY
ncbi:hypothetical protein FRB99_000122 [Tulasnella sp. 403]|nr:hypothetical protein FRB99_000122 [Tulasnella sp. 403]